MARTRHRSIPPPRAGLPPLAPARHGRESATPLRTPARRRALCSAMASRDLHAGHVGAPLQLPPRRGRREEEGRAGVDLREEPFAVASSAAPAWIRGRREDDCQEPSAAVRPVAAGGPAAPVRAAARPTAGGPRSGGLDPRRDVVRSSSFFLALLLAAAPHHLVRALCFFLPEPLRRAAGGLRAPPPLVCVPPPERMARGGRRRGRARTEQSRAWRARGAPAPPRQLRPAGATGEQQRRVREEEAVERLWHGRRGGPRAGDRSRARPRAPTAEASAPRARGSPAAPRLATPPLRAAGARAS